LPAGMGLPSTLTPGSQQPGPQTGDSHGTGQYL